MEKQFFPNACYICQATTNLKRCDCQMISYCREEHRVQHRPEHREICRAVCSMIEEANISHLFQKLVGADMHLWRKSKLLLSMEAATRINRQLTSKEAYLFLFPRSCYVCHESRQALLKNCPNCPVATFCTKHPSSIIHDKDCAKFGKTFDAGVKLSQRIEKHGLIQTQMVLTSVLHAIKYAKEPVISMEDFLAKFTTSKNISLKIENDLQFWMSQMYSTILTVYSALRKLGLSTRPKLTLSMMNYNDCYDEDLWEALLHLLPELIDVTLVFSALTSPVPIVRKQIDLCLECNRKEKKVTFCYVAICQDENLSLRRYFDEPSILVSTDIADAEKIEFSERTFAPKLLSLWSTFDFPLVMTTVIEDYHEDLKKTIATTLKDIDIFFEGFNPFRSFLSMRNSYQRAGETNGFMIILKPLNKPEP